MGLKVMKKSLLVVVLLFSFFPVFSIDDIYKGTYIPSIFYEHFCSTLNYEEAKYRPYKDYHDILYVYDEDILSSLKFHDSYVISKEEIKDYSFINKECGTFIIDNKGNLYKKIGEECKEEEFYSYVFSSLFKTITDLDYVMLLDNNTKIKIHNTTYELLLDSTLLYNDGIAFYLRGDDGIIYAVVLNGISATIYYCQEDEYGDFWEVTPSIKEEFKVFSYKPLCDLDKMDSSNLRIYRNLQFAKHGHIFNSEELKNLFSHFFWYIPVDSSKETSLTKTEKNIVNKVRHYEKMIEWENGNIQP